MTIERLESTNVSNFIKMSKEEQKRFLSSIEIHALKAKQDLLLLKKYIAMKVLMIARSNVEDKSLFNIQAQFRQIIGVLQGEPAAVTVQIKKAGISSSSDQRSVGYRFFHTSDLGFYCRKNKSFHLEVDENNNNILTQKCSSEVSLSGFKWKDSDVATWSKLNEENDLRALLAEIKKEVSYETTFGYDFLCMGMYCANLIAFFSLLLSYETKLIGSVIFVPLALALNLAIYTLVLPPALTSIVIECLIINPLKALCESLSADEHESFVQEVTTPAIAI